MSIAGIRRAARSDVGLLLGEVCPLPPASGVVPAPESGSPAESGPRLRDPTHAAENDDEHVEYVAFTAESGSISKMAIVRRRLARVLGRYLLGEPIAAGGMATVHLGRLLGPAGFSRTVAVKRLHSHLAGNPEFVQRFVDEARIASRVRHANVVQTLDVVAIDEELLLVLDYVHGESFARLRRLASAAGKAIPPSVAASIVIGVLRGLHAAHESKSAKGTALDLVHRDVSPQNILVGADGIARVLDFGIAKAAGRIHETVTRDLKGKLSYMSPEQLSGENMDRRADLFAVGVVLWEALAGERLFRCEDAMATMDAIFRRDPPRLSERGLGIRPDVDDVLARALAKDANVRFETADAMARAIETVLPPASDREVAEWVEETAGAVLAERIACVAEFEGDDTGGSKARLYAAEPSELTTSRRDALMPPPLESVTNETATKDSITNENLTATSRLGTMPTLEMETGVALAAAAALAAAVGHGPLANGPPGSVELEGVSELRPMHTPFVMISPANAMAEARESGNTRIDPVERRLRTPIPMPMPLAQKRRGPSVFHLALLVVVPPFLVAVALVGVRPSRSAAAGGNGASPAATMTMATQAVTAPVLVATAPPVAAPVPVPVPVPVPPGVVAKGDKKAAKPPGHRASRPVKGPATPIPVSRQ